MKYIIRLNPKAISPLSKKIFADKLGEKKLWQVEQCESTDSAAQFWLCENIRIGQDRIEKFFVPPDPGQKPWEYVVYGCITRGGDDAIVILRGKRDV